MSKDGLFMMFGAPMFRQQSGYVYIMYRDSRATDNFKKYQSADDLKLYFLCDKDQLKRYKGYNKASEDGLLPTFSSIICDIDLTYGYSLTSLNTSNGYYLVTGGPRAANLHGKIQIFKFHADKREYMADTFQFLDPLTGSSLNTGFGTTLVGADLDGDGTDELLVGEPYYTDPSSDTFNSGRISIYRFNQITKQSYSFVLAVKSPTPSQSNMFGFKVACLGDIDDDGGEDFLVTALNETTNGDTGTGKVYLFSGRSVSALFNQDTDEPKVLQHFTADQSELFGFSIGDARTDIDGNGFNDLVIGDPGKRAQFARVFYAKTLIRLLYPDGINKRHVYREKNIEPDCPPAIQKKDFCKQLVVYLENRGVAKLNMLYPDRPARMSPWQFKGRFTVEVSLRKQPDNSKLQIYAETKSVEFGPDVTSKHLTFWIYADLQEAVYGDSIVIVADTALKGGDSIGLENSDKYKGDITLAPTTFRQVDVAIGEEIDVRMWVKPQYQRVVLGTDTTDLNFTINFATVDGKMGNFVNGKLVINVGETNIGFTTVTSTPTNFLSCTKTTNKIECSIYNNKKFANAEVIITVSVDDLAAGKIMQENVDLTYSLTWANRATDDLKLEDHSTLIVTYDATLSAVPTPGSTTLDSPFRSGITLDYNLGLSNLGQSSIGAIEVNAWAPYYSPPKFAIKTLESCEVMGLLRDSGNCSSELCQHYKCKIGGLGGAPASRQVPFVVTFSDPTFWKLLVEKKTEFWADVSYEVTEEADYMIKLDQGMYPRMADGGSTRLETFVSSEKAPFPWWIVLVTLIVSILIVVVIIIFLYRRGFFTKQDPRKIRADQIKDGEVQDEEMEMTLKKDGPLSTA